MTTQVMSARVDASKLKYANQLTQKECGMSFAKYCGSIILNNVCSMHNLPIQQEDKDKDRKRRLTALEEICKFAESLKDTEAANLTDEEVKRIIRDRDM